MLNRGDIDELKAVFDRCELTVYASQFDMSTVLHHHGESYLNS